MKYQTFSKTDVSVPSLVDLNAPNRNPTTCPAWARVATPDWLKPFQGVNGAPEAFPESGLYASCAGGVELLYASCTEGVDRYQANQFIWYRPETSEYLYSDYTPLKVDYQKGTLPRYEALAAHYTVGCKTDTDKAVALLVNALPNSCRHPGMPPLGKPVPPDRNLDDEALLATGSGWCNEQARIFIRLCQVSGIQARLVHLFGQNHTVAEFYADGKWAMADGSIHFVVEGTDGRLLSAEECHDGGANQRLYAEAKVRRMKTLSGLTSEALGFTDEAHEQRWREGVAKMEVDELAVRPIYFGVINYPLPTTES